MEDQEVKGRKAAIEQEKLELASTSERERLRVGASAGTEGRWPKGKAMDGRVASEVDTINAIELALIAEVQPVFANFLQKYSAS